MNLSLRELFIKAKNFSSKHEKYFDVYEENFSKYKGKKITFVEVGIFNGGSLKIWKEYFGPDAKIIGIDINPESPWNINDDTPVFSPQEITDITENNIPVSILNGFIHPDDTISTIKTKIIKYTNLRISTAELYLFGITTNKINPAVLYNQLTQNDTLKLTKERICHALLNIVDINCDDTNVKSICSLLEDPRDTFDFEDLLSKVREQDKELAALREGAAPAGEADPYKVHKARETDTGE